ncbi:ferritin family protein [Shewanella glacialimarina]|uniref:hypothetical protein n=1 Tax=Shewanella glacialimarina TaxID=2590884 RepID=UPI001CF8CFE0|nr:hypothetical protein [Shewanella glacialimarina]UCX06443.1 hypothetical protein FJ709_19205 [Shewanella glacialimarina]
MTLQYSHIKRLSSKQIDLGVISDAIDLCQAGQLFYTKAIADADDYNIKRIFMDMAETRRCILQYLVPLLQQVKQDEIVPYDAQPISLFSFSDEYDCASEAIKQDELWTALGLLLDIEQQVLHQLKWAARQATNKEVAQQLAEGCAWLQIGCDSMESLYVSHKGKAN